MTDQTADLRRGVDALSFALVRHPGEPPRLDATQAKPPADKGGYQAMIAASQLSKMMLLVGASGERPAAQAAADLQRQILTADAGRHELIKRYREALLAALAEFLGYAGDERIAELLRWYEQDRKTPDG